MSFREVLRRHEDQKARRAGEDQDRITALHEADAEFRAQFAKAVKTIAAPLFEDLAKELSHAGYEAKVASFLETSKDPFIEIRFLARSVAEPNDDEYSVFVLKGEPSTGKVVQGAFYDQRPGDERGSDTKSLALSSINRNTLERDLENFLKKSLESH